MADLPNKGFISYLASYTPASSNSGSYDEYVSKQAKKNQVDPLKFKNNYLEDIVSKIKAQGAGVYALVGIAGDGKTYLCRSIWQELNIGNDPLSWEKGWRKSDSKGVLKDTFQDIPTVCVKDLSEVAVDSAEEQEILTLLIDIVFNQKLAILLLTANDGQLIGRLKSFLRKQFSSETQQILQAVEDFFLEHKNFEFTQKRFYIYDLRRLITPDYIQDVIQQIINQESWQKCQDCEYEVNCPIWGNRNYLKDNPYILKTLHNVFTIILANGMHITMRNLLLFISNILLGVNTQRIIVAKDLKNNFIKCSDIPYLTQQDRYCSNVFENMFGFNLKPSNRVQYDIFEYLNSLKIGEETNKLCDELLMYGNKLDGTRDVYEQYVLKAPIDHEYWKQVKVGYQRRSSFDFNDEDSLSEIFNYLRNLRTCLFFTLDNKNKLRENYAAWGLTLYRHASSYLSLLKYVRDKGRKVSTRISNIKSDLVLGLNRLFTGMYFPNAKENQLLSSGEGNKLYLAESGGYSSSTSSRLFVKAFEYDEEERANTFAIVCSADREELPVIEVRIANKDKQLSKVIFKLRPMRFEFICRIAQGYLPVSFSNECLEDVLAFRSNLLFAIEQNHEREIDKLNLIKLHQGSISIKAISLIKQTQEDEYDVE